MFTKRKDSDVKSKVAKWIDSWPAWERALAREILSRELTNPLNGNDLDKTQTSTARLRDKPIVRASDRADRRRSVGEQTRAIGNE